MFEIKVKDSFSAAHNLKNYHGKCERLHGHNWVVEAIFLYRTLDKIGMAVDFKAARKVLKSVIDKFDHSYLNKLKFFKGINPTSENIAKFIHDEIRRRNKNLKSIGVWENENSCAIYTEE